MVRKDTFSSPSSPSVGTLLTRREVHRHLLGASSDSDIALDRWEGAVSGEIVTGVYQQIIRQTSPMSGLEILLIVATTLLSFSQVVIVGDIYLGLIFLLVFYAVICIVLLIWLPLAIRKSVRAATRMMMRGERNSLIVMAHYWRHRSYFKRMTENDKRAFASFLLNLKTTLTNQERTALIALCASRYPGLYRPGVKDFNIVEAEILCAAMRCLFWAPDENSARIVRRIAGYSVGRNNLNRRIVRDMARTFLGQGKPQVDSMMLPPMATTTTDTKKTMAQPIKPTLL
jgi:hypothetical protein